MNKMPLKQNLKSASSFLKDYEASPQPDLDTTKGIILYLEGINVSFDSFKAINELNLYIKQGELRCIIGPNGAGKTTMMDVITGKTKPQSGTAWFGQKLNLLTMDEPQIAQAGIGRKFQKPTVFEALTVNDNLMIANAGKKTVWHTLRHQVNQIEQEQIEEILLLIGLMEMRNEYAAILSHGQKQWLELGMLLMQKPQLLLVDEPVAGMTTQEMDKTAELLNSLAGKHTLIVVEHDMDFVRQIAKTVSVLHQGSILAEGNMEQVQNNPKVIEVYLGQSTTGRNVNVA